MDILRRIDELRRERNWSIYKLADEAGITQSTLANMFTRKTLPSLTTLTQLCEAFNMSLSEFFYEGKKGYSLDESILIENYRKLKLNDKEIVNNLIKMLIKNH